MLERFAGYSLHCLLRCAHQEDDDRRFPLTQLASSAPLFAVLTSVLDRDAGSSEVAWKILQALPPHQPLFQSLFTLTKPVPAPAAPAAPAAAAGKKPPAVKAPPPLPLDPHELFDGATVPQLLYQLMVRDDLGGGGSALSGVLPPAVTSSAVTIMHRCLHCRGRGWTDGLNVKPLSVVSSPGLGASRRALHAVSWRRGFCSGNHRSRAVR